MLDQIRRQVAVGVLREGQQVPSVRQLAEQLAVNQNTVLKVYNQLCLEGILRVDRGNGTFVAPGAGTAGRVQGREMVAQAVREVVTQAVQLGLGPEELAELMQQQYEALRRGRKQTSPPPPDPASNTPSGGEQP
jgi:GntR family transcriptional regulator